MDVIFIKKFTIICITMSLLFSMFGCASKTDMSFEADNSDTNENYVSSSIPIKPEPLESNNPQSSNPSESSPISANNKYFTDTMPPLTPEEEKIVNEPVPDDIRNEFENFNCFPNNGLGDTFTYGELWRYIGEDGGVTLKGSLLKKTDADIFQSEYPSILPHLKSVKRLTIDMYTVELPVADIGKMVWLEKLSIGGDMSPSFVEIPDEFYNLTNLKLLCIGGVGMERFPDRIDVFENLEALHLDYNHIEYISESILKLKNLRILVLSYNSIAKLPKGISSLMNLKVLELMGNPLTTIPNEICELTSLEILSLGEDMSRYKYGVNDELYNKYLENGPIPGLADSLPNDFGNLINLKELEIWDFPITTLPDSFGNLKNLEKLWLVLPLKTLPESFANLDNLKDVSFYGDNSDELMLLAQEMLKS